MITLVKVQARGVLTLPKKIRTRMKIDTGDMVELEERPDGKLFITPVSRIDRELYEDVRSALEDLRQGRTIGPFASAKEFELYRKSKGKK